MKHWIAAATFFAILILALMAWRDLAVPPEFDCDVWACDLYVAIRDFQTLIGGALAILAAWMAARPAWLQLRSMAIQQELASRQVVADRLSGIETRARTFDIAIAAYLHEINSTLYDPHDETFEASVDAHWTHRMGHEAGAILGQLQLNQDLRQDTQQIEAKRKPLIEELIRLQNCMYEICAPAEYAGDPELTDEHLLEMEQQERVARSALPKITSRVEEKRDALAKITRLEIGRLRNRLRAIDDTAIP